MSKCGKKVAHVTNRGSSFDNTLSIIVKLPSNNINKKDYNDYVLQAILPLYTNTIKDSLFHLGGVIVDFINTNTWAVVVEVGHNIMGYHIIWYH